MMRMAVMLTLGAFAAGLWCSAQAAAPPSSGDDEDARLAAFFERYLDRWLADEPLTATRLGEHRHDARLDDLSPEARARRATRDRETLARLETEIDPARLSRDGQIDRDILRHHLQYALWLDEHFQPFQNDPRIWGDYTTESVYLLFTQSTLPDLDNLNNAIERVKQVPRVLETARTTIGTPPLVKLETAISQTRGAIAFYTPHWENGEGSDLFTVAGIPGPGDVPLLEEAARAARTALEAHLNFLENEVRPRADDSWRIGPELFAHKLELELDAGLTADEVLAEAQREAQRVETEMAVIARQLWSQYFPGEAVPTSEADGRQRMIRRVLERIGQKHSTPDTIVSDVRDGVADITRFIASRNVLRLPEPDRCQVVPMPEFQRGNSTAYLNPAPPLDPAASSQYAVAPPPGDWTDEQIESYFREYNRAMLQILTIHEAYPGHYVQLEYSNRCDSLIRKVLSSGTFAEGWAVYTEQMMLDEGYGSGDLALRMQQLKFYLRAVLNAILDHEMHAGQMTDDEARALLMGRGFQTEGEALGKIIRSKQSSAQLSTYFVGRTAFHRLRQEIQRGLGDQFDLGPYHEAVLSHGTLPVKYLPELVRRDLDVPANDTP